METGQALRLRRESAETNALTQQLRSVPVALLSVRVPQQLVRVVYEMTPSTVGAKTNGVKSATWLGLVLRVPVEASQLIHAVRKLTFGTVLAGAALFVGAAELRLVAGGQGRGGRTETLWGGQGAVADAEAGRWR